MQSRSRGTDRGESGHTGRVSLYGMEGRLHENNCRTTQRQARNSSSVGRRQLNQAPCIIPSLTSLYFRHSMSTHPRGPVPAEPSPVVLNRHQVFPSISNWRERLRETIRLALFPVDLLWCRFSTTGDEKRDLAHRTRLGRVWICALLIDAGVAFFYTTYHNTASPIEAWSHVKLRLTRSRGSLSTLGTCLRDVCGVRVRVRACRLSACGACENMRWDGRWQVPGESSMPHCHNAPAVRPYSQLTSRSLAATSQ